MNHKLHIMMFLRSFFLVVATVVTMLLTGCGAAPADADKSTVDSLRAQLQAIADSARGRIGIALITPDSRVITINNTSDYQLMSVFKLHQALAVGHALDEKGVSLDTVISVNRTELNPDTWSPMLKEHSGQVISMPVAELLRYIIQLSDNNASNLLFDRIVSVAECDSFIHRSTGVTDFALKYTEGQMFNDYSLADGNVASPLSCAQLIGRVFTDSIISPEKQAYVQRLLLGCQTGPDRLSAPLRGVDGVTLAHKTGSGARNASGELMAHNDVGRFTLPDGRTYILAVMIRNYKGSDAEASSLIAEISRKVFGAISGNR